MRTAIINEELFREYCPVKEVTNAPAAFLPYIGIAQKMYIEPILGVPLIDEIQRQITSGNISTEIQALIRAVAPALSFYTAYQGLPFHWASIVNKGVTVRESENSKGVAISDVAQLRRWLKDDAEVLARDLVEFLTAHRSEYPAWRTNDTCGCGSEAAKPFDFGVYIPNRR